MTRDELIRKLAEIISGLQVPSSIGGPHALGAAYEPHRDVKLEVRGFGYTDADETEEYLRKMLDAG